MDNRRNLYKFVIKTYKFGNVKYPIYVRAKCIEDARQIVYNYPKYRNDEDAEIESEGWISMHEDGVIDDAKVIKCYPAFSDSED